jgi:hypothetical protein
MAAKDSATPWFAQIVITYIDNPTGCKDIKVTNKTIKATKAIRIL